jgi:tRNA threonylcarbamoyladenosine biosynthesis protein TsaB|tara:strand:- start:61 stop:699 length:639 start_codon:yes stop_codon:yes gene_type:complete
MKILGIETSVKQSSAAIVVENDSYEVFSDIKKDAAKSLPFIVENVLNKAQSSFNDIDGIAISMGPGSFTGLRVGLSYVKGLSLALDIPIVPISTFESMINIVKPNPGKVIQTIIHSHGNALYIAQYISKDELYVLDSVPKIIDINDLECKKDMSIIYVGPNKIVDQLNIKEMNNIQLTALSIASLGYNNYDFLKTKSINNLAPNYIGSFKLD